MGQEKIIKNRGSEIPLLSFVFIRALSWLISFPCVLVFLLLPGLLWADQLEVGLGYSFAYRWHDTFDRGMEKYRTTLNPSTLSASQADDFRLLNAGEFSFRFGEFPGENQFLGLTVGSLAAPALAVKEIRTDGTYTDTEWRFRVPYFLFTYAMHIPVERIRFLRQWKWELGGGFGFIPDGRWNVDGYSISPIQVRQTNSRQVAASGNILRLEAGIYRTFREHFFFRGGLRFTYAYLGGFQGTINNTDGSYYYLKNGGIMPLSPTSLMTANAYTNDPVLGPVQITVVREKTRLSMGLTEIHFAIGTHFE